MTIALITESVAMDRTSRAAYVGLTLTTTAPSHPTANAATMYCGQFGGADADAIAF